MKELLLTVALPIFNSKERCFSCVLDIFEKIKFFDNVEFLISDNFSDDGTWEEIERAISSLSNISKSNIFSVYRNDRNLGVDENFNICVKKAKGNFVWFVGDDDKILDNSISKLLKILNNLDFNINHVFLNTLVFERNINSGLLIKIFKDQTVTNNDDFLKLLETSAAVTPTIVVRKSSWMQANCDLFMGSGWYTLSKIFYLKNQGSSLLLSDVFSHFNADSQRWHKNGKFVFMLIDLLHLIDFLENWKYSKSSIISLSTKIISNLPRNVMIGRIQGLKITQKVFVKIFYLKYSNFLFKIKFLIVCLCPLFLISVAKKIYIFFK